ncbi:Mitochondrial ATPase expression domain containing protein [Rhypophila decipiens]
MVRRLLPGAFRNFHLNFPRQPCLEHGHLLTRNHRHVYGPNPGQQHRYATLQPDCLQPGPLSTSELELLQYILTTEQGSPDNGNSSYSGRPTDAESVLLRPESLAPKLTKSLTNPLDRLSYLQELISEALTAKKTKGSDWPSHSAIALLPGTVFSELFRSLDTLNTLSRELDSTTGIHVGPGMATESPIGQEFDIWGVRKAYVTVLRRLMAAAQLRLEARHRLTSSDYQVLLRAAGSASDYESVKAIWALIVQQRLPLHGGLYHDFLRARFLTEPLYTQYSLEWLRVRPLSIVTQKKGFKPDPRKVSKLSQAVRKRVRRQVERFGQNRSKTATVNYLYRNMRKGMPPLRLYNHVTDSLYPLEEGVITALIVSFGRAGSMWFVEKMILPRYWNITVTKSRCAGFEVTAGEPPVHFAPDDPMRPTKRLIEAVIDCYGCNGEIAGAIKVAMAISHRYDIPMSHELWSKLFGWAYVAGCNVSREEWTTIGMADRLAGKGTLESIWDTMTAEPYNVKPDFMQHCLLVTNMIRQRQYRLAVQAMEDKLEPMYRDIQTELEEAFYKEAMTRALGVVDPTQKAKKAWSDALVRKHAAWYWFQRMCRTLMMNTRHPDNDSSASSSEQAGPDYEFTTQIMPRFIDRFRDVMPRLVKYQGISGTVHLVNVQQVNRMWWTKVWREKPGIATVDLLRFKPLDEAQRIRLRNRPANEVSETHPRGLDIDIFLQVPRFDRPRRLQREFL